jgi:alkyl hydroperoxide reductase subunit AhpF
MAFLSDADREQVRDLLAEMTDHVVLRFYTQAIGCESCPETRQILDLLAELGDGKITVDERNLVLDQSEQDPGVDRVPTIVVIGRNADDSERDEGVRFVGGPFGYEFTSLIDAVLLVSRRETGLSENSLALLSSVTSPMSVQVFTTPT